MKVVVSTTEGSGRTGDFNFTKEGELVYLGLVCGTDEETRTDSGCGCARRFSGMETGKATTTAKVVEMEGMTFERHVDALEASYARAGWAGSVTREEIAEESTEMCEIASLYPVGTILERWFEDVDPRKF